MTTQITTDPYSLPKHSTERYVAIHGSATGDTSLLPELVDLLRKGHKSVEAMGWVVEDQGETVLDSGPAIYRRGAYTGHLSSSQGDGGGDDTFMVYDESGEVVAKAYAPFPGSSF